MKKIFLLVSIMLITALVVSGADPDSVGKGQNIRFANESNFDAENVDYTFVNQIPDPAEPGQYVEVRWKVENFGGTDVDSLTVELIPEFPFSLLPGDDGIRKIGSIHSRQIGTEGVVIYYKLLVDKDAVEGNSEIRLRYSLNDGKSWIRLDPFLVRVKTHDAILAVDSVSSEPEEIKPGETANVSISLKNYADSLLKDVRFVLDLSGVPVSPVSSSNEKVVEKIGAKTEKSLNFKLIADADAESKVHKIPYELKYVDNLGNSINKTGTLGLVVNEKPQFSVNLEEIEVYTSEQKGSVTVSISNVGSSEIKFMTLGLEGSNDYKILSSPKVYIGNIESDDFETAEFDVFIESEKEEIPVNVLLEYKDSYNKGYKTTKTLKLPLYSSGEAKNLGLIQGSSAGYLFMTFVILVITSVFWLFMLMDLRKNKMKRYEKWLWFALVFFTHFVGAAIYYFIGRKKELGKR